MCIFCYIVDISSYNKNLKTKQNKTKRQAKLFSQPQFVCNPLGNSIYMPVLVLAFLDQGCFKAKNCVCMSAMVKRISASAL